MDSGLVQQGLPGGSKLLSIRIVRNDHIVFEEDYNGSDRSHSNNIHSASKTVLSTLIGIAIEEGLINGVDAKVSDIMPEYFDAYPVDDGRRDITVGHLLAMQAGLDWVEDGTEYTLGSDDDWIQEILGRGLDNPPGEQFHYSTGLSHITAAVLTRATGMALPDYAHDRLFGPLNINADHWGRDPQGIFSGGYNLYLTPREMARFGLMILNRGVVDGVQVVPEWVVDDVFDSSESYKNFWWIESYGGHDTFIAWGWGGQFIHVIPDLDLLFVSTTDTSRRPRETDAETFLEDYVIPSIFKPGDVNGDGQVDGLDVNIISANWYLLNVALNQGDLNGDGIVNGLDANLVSEYWGSWRPRTVVALSSRFDQSA